MISKQIGGLLLALAAAFSTYARPGIVKTAATVSAGTDTTRLERFISDTDSIEPGDTLLTVSSTEVDSMPWPANVRRQIDRLLESDMFETSQVGMLIYDLDADSAIYARGERQLLRPASTMKTITAITALDRLGESWQFKTELCYTGKVEAHTLRGDVYCVGGFDPRFNSDDMRAFAEALKRMGVDTIRGNIYADKSMKDDDRLGEGWCWDDDNPVLTPLLYGREDDFMQHFSDALRADRIFLTGTVGEKRRPHEAVCIINRFHTIDQILIPMLKRSDNLYAEAMYYQIARSTGDHPATARSAQRIVRQLIQKVGLDPRRYELADGSGLSLYNYLTAEMEVRFLRYAFHDQNIYNHLYPALPIAGVDGTLSKRMRETFTRGNVHAKTGTLQGVSSLCGYLTAYNGHHIAFALINQGVQHTRNAHRFQDKVCAILCAPH